MTTHLQPSTLNLQPATRHFVLDARTATPHFPGIGRYVSNLARAMAPLLIAGERLTIIHDPAHPLALPANAVSAASANIQSIALAASPFSLKQQWVMPRLLRRLRGDLYHSAYVLMPYWPGIPTLLTVYDLIPLRYPAHSSARARRLIRITTRLALRAARQVAAISEFTRADFMAEFGLPSDRIAAVPLAADPAFRPQPPEAIAELRARYRLPEQFVLYLGSNKPHKNLVRLVEAWQMADGERRMADGGLVIAGSWDPRYPEARELAVSLAAHATKSRSEPQSSVLNPQSIRWLGPVSEVDLPALYSAATAFIFPSLYEGFGLPVLEAMACGTPVICSNTSSLPEVAGTAALQVNPMDTAALATALKRVQGEADLRTELRMRGLTRAAEFTWTQTAATTLTLYRKMLS